MYLNGFPRDSDLFFFFSSRESSTNIKLLLPYPNKASKNQENTLRPATMGFTTLCRRLFCIRPSRYSQEESDTWFEPIVSRVPSMTSVYDGGISADSSTRQSEVIRGRPRVYSDCGNPFAPGLVATQRRYLSCGGNPYT